MSAVLCGTPALGCGTCGPSPDGRRWDPDNFSADLRAANALAYLAWRCLDYRHTFASQLARKGVLLYKISQLMGNSPDICQNRYAALLPQRMAPEVHFPSPQTGAFYEPSRVVS